MGGAYALALGIGAVVLVFVVMPLLWGAALEVTQPTPEPEGEEGEFENEATVKLE